MTREFGFGLIVFEPRPRATDRIGPSLSAEPAAELRHGSDLSNALDTAASLFGADRHPDAPRMPRQPSAAAGAGSNWPAPPGCDRWAPRSNPILMVGPQA